MSTASEVTGVCRKLILDVIILAESFKYEQMKEILNDRIPEVLTMDEYNEMISFWANEEIPMYCYYELLEHLFLKLLKKEIRNDELLVRVLDFMEDMAKSEDIEVQNLLQVQILEALFGLDYYIFNNMEKNLLRPQTLTLFQPIKSFFNAPKPPKEN